MKGSKAINSRLNDVLRHELTAINQYFLHARMLKNRGFHALGKQEYKYSIEVMKEADDLIERILFLEGLPNLQDLDKLLIGEDVPEILRNDLAMQRAIWSELLVVTAECEQASDFVSRCLLAQHLEECEGRINFYETQLDLLGNVGLQNYLQAAIDEVET